MSTLDTQVSEYINSFDPIIKKRLLRLKKIITDSTETITESISYGIPTYKIGGKPFAYFAGYKNHIGFYPGDGSTLAKFKQQLGNYKTSVGGFQIKHSDPFPIELLKEIIEYKLGLLNSK